MALPEGGKHAEKADVSGVHVPRHLHTRRSVDQPLLRCHLRHCGYMVRSERRGGCTRLGLALCIVLQISVRTHMVLSRTCVDVPSIRGRIGSLLSLLQLALTSTFKSCNETQELGCIDGAHRPGRHLTPEAPVGAGCGNVQHYPRQRPGARNDLRRDGPGKETDRTDIIFTGLWHAIR